MKGGKTKNIHGKELYEDPQWAGWTYYSAPILEGDDVVKQEDSYWYNPATGEQRLQEPVWEDEWKIRVQRSRFDGTQNDLLQYFDELTSGYFQYHELTDSYM